MRRKRNHKKRTGSQTGIKKFISFLLFRLFLASMLVGAVLVVYLDMEVRKYIDGNFQSEPARIYSRPSVLQTGLSYPLADLEKSLRRRGYTRVKVLSSVGEYVLKKTVMDIYVQAYNDGLIVRPAQVLKLRFSEGQLTKITLHKTGKAISQFYLSPLEIGSLQFGSDKEREFLQLHEMPEYLIQSLLIMEDRKFQFHKGIDLHAIGRAAFSNMVQSDTTQGGSTITQQLVKNLFLTPNQTLSRKAMEALLAIIMELRFTKAEILEMYVNEIFLGQSGSRAIHGFPLASQFFFAKPVQQLSLPQAALLVGIVPAPSYYNPYRHPERALKRRKLVLSTLASQSIINTQEADRLSNLPLGLSPYQSLAASEFNTFIDYMHRQLRQYYSEDILRTNGLKLYTSMDVEVQRTAQQQLSQTLSALESERNIKVGTLQGAVVAIDTTNGDILAMVGDRKKGYFGFNRAIDAQRPIGSLVKPAVFLTALSRKGYSLVTPLSDRPFSLTTQDNQQWTPKNYDEKYRGDVLLYKALVHSYNVPTVRLGIKIGVENVIKTMRKLGIRRHIEPYPSTLLGAGGHSVLEVGQMYQTIANKGKRHALRSLRSIENKSSQIMARFPLKGQNVIKSEYMYLVDYALQLVTQQGTAQRLSNIFDPSLHIAGKTGTTNDFRDSWYAGYAGNILTVVWVGRDDNQPTGLSGSSGAMRVWANIMSNLSLRPDNRAVKEKIKMVNIDIETGDIANYQCPQNILLPFVKGTEPKNFSPCSGLAGKLMNFLRRTKSEKQEKPISNKNK